MSIIIELDPDENGDARLIVELDSDGNVVDAQTYSEVFSCYFECTVMLKNSDYWMEKVRESYETLPREKEYTGEEELTA